MTEPATTVRVADPVDWATARRLCSEQGGALVRYEFLAEDLAVADALLKASKGGDGYWMGATFDGGHTWASIFKDPKTSTGDRCFGSDPTVVYSLRDSAFYVGTLCFFRNPIGVT